MEPLSRDPIELLQAMPLFGGIRADSLLFLLKEAAVVKVSRGDFFYHEGDDADSLFILQTGKVVMLKHWQGSDYALKSLQRGDCFGQVALIDLHPRNTTTLAAEDATALELTAANLYRLSHESMEQFALIYMNMAREVCRRLREADKRTFEADMRARKIE